MGGNDLTPTSNRWSERARRATEGAREHMREARERWQGRNLGSSAMEAPAEAQTTAGRHEGPAVERGEVPSATGRGEAVTPPTEQASRRRDSQRADLAYAVHLLQESSKILDEARALH
jgi:hypothetical protein